MRQSDATGREAQSPAPRARLLWTIAAGVAAVGLLAGCGGQSAPEVADGVVLRVVIPDASIRQPEAPCSGAHGFRFAHAQAPYSVQDPTGREVASGTLPEGSAEKAFSMDLGEDRQPTVCVMMVDVPGVDVLAGHSLVIDDRSPVPIKANPSLAGIPEVVLR